MNPRLSRDGRIKLWDTRSGEQVRTLEGHSHTVGCVAFSPNVDVLASGGGWYDETVRLWITRTGEKDRILEGHTRGVDSIAFSPDGVKLATASRGSIRMWDTRTGEHLKRFEGHTLEVLSVAFSPDGLTLGSLSADGTILLWEATRVTTWGSVKKDGVPEMRRESSEVSPSAAPLSSTETALLPNYPNPFNPETWIPYQLANPADVALNIYVNKGQAVRTLGVGHQPAGIYESRSRAAYWDGRNHAGEPVGNGVYWCTLNAGDYRESRKMVIQK